MKKLSILLGTLILVFGLVFTVKAWDDESYTICHVPPGNEGNPQTLNLSEEGAANHLQNHELDYEGPCQEEEPEDVCTNIEGVQSEVPEGYILQDDECFPNPHPSPSPVPCEQTEEGCPSPTPTPEPSNPPSEQPSGNVTTPSCPNGNTANVPAWPHVARSGEQAVVNAFLTDGDNAQIYWKIVGQDNWQYSSAQSNSDGVKPNSDKWIDYTIHGLDPALGYTFGIQQRSGCGGGLTVTAVIVDGPATKTFEVSYYEVN